MSKSRLLVRTPMCLLAAWCIAAAAPLHAGETTIAVAANFTAPAREIAAGFRDRTGHDAVLSFGATGQLYAQISQGAPFDVYLAADRARPRRAVDEGLAVPGSLFTYATGRLVLYSRGALAAGNGEVLRKTSFDNIAIANPATAPYGVAAVQVMKTLGVHARLAGKIVRGNNVSQTYQFIETGSVALGFVALSQVVDHERGSRWIVPERMHAPIAQGAVLLKRGASNPEALAFADFLKSPAANKVKRRYGYGTGD